MRLEVWKLSPREAVTFPRIAELGVGLGLW